MVLDIVFLLGRFLSVNLHDDFVNDLTVDPGSDVRVTPCLNAMQRFHVGVT
jgi:hypothetical protein